MDVVQLFLGIEKARFGTKDIFCQIAQLVVGRQQNLCVLEYAVRFDSMSCSSKCANSTERTSRRVGSRSSGDPAADLVVVGCDPEDPLREPATTVAQV